MPIGSNSNVTSDNLSYKHIQWNLKTLCYCQNIGFFPVMLSRWACLAFVLHHRKIQRFPWGWWISQDALRHQVPWSSLLHLQQITQKMWGLVWVRKSKLCMIIHVTLSWWSGLHNYHEIICHTVQSSSYSPPRERPTGQHLIPWSEHETSFQPFLSALATCYDDDPTLHGLTNACCAFLQALSARHVHQMVSDDIICGKPIDLLCPIQCCCTQSRHKHSEPRFTLWL